MKEKVKSYLAETKKELTKVSWPEKDAVLASSGVVLVVLIFLALLFFVEDNILKYVLMIRLFGFTG